MPKLIFCPFLLEDSLSKRGKKGIVCEHGKLIFNDKRSVREYMDKYCGCEDGWKTCTLATSLLSFYEREDN